MLFKQGLWTSSASTLMQHGRSTRISQQWPSHLQVRFSVSCVNRLLLIYFVNYDTAIVVISVVMIIFLCCIGTSGTKAARNAAATDQRRIVAERKKKDETEADDQAVGDSDPAGTDATSTEPDSAAGKPKKKGSRKAD